MTWIPTETEDASQPLQFQLVDIRVLDRSISACDIACIEDVQGANFNSYIMEDESEYLKNNLVALIGCTLKGNSVCVFVHGFRPYLYYNSGEVNTSKSQLILRIAKAINCSEDDLSIQVVKGRDLYGWQPNMNENPTDFLEHTFFKVFFPNVHMMRKASKTVKGAHEVFISPETKFNDLVDIIPSGWAQVPFRLVPPEHKRTYCQLEVSCQITDVKPVARDEVAPLMVAAIDIETYSSTGSFPEKTNPEDTIQMIGAVYFRYGFEMDPIKCVYVVGECAPIEGAHVFSYRTEYDLLRGFRASFVYDFDPDIVATYNGFGFDCEWLWERARLLDCEEFAYLDRIILQKSSGQSKELSSSALSDNSLFIINMVGRSNLDLFHWIKAREKLNFYKLDYVCEHFLGEKKVEMDYKELFKLLKGSPEDIKLASVYCIQDCYLLKRLMDYFFMLPQNVEMSRTTNTSMEALITRGQQFKCINLINRFAHRDNIRPGGHGCFIMNTPAKFSGTKDDSYEGATVIDAQTAYYTVPIAVLDFMSLYPSIMMANNLCFSTIVLNDKYKNLPGVQYETIQVTQEKQYTWAKNFPGLLPKILEHLLSARKKAKKDKANAKNKAEKAVFDGRQLALKVSANSIYGFTGAVKTGTYSCLGVADTTTWKAREMLHQTVVWVKEFHPCEVVYGDTDSVMVKFQNVNTIEESFDLGDKASEVITEQFSQKYNTNKIILEMEKVYYPWLLMNKKRYAGLMYERAKSGKVELSYLDAKGIELVRRDNCPFAKRVQQDILDALMYKMDSNLAVQELHRHLNLVVDNKIPIEDFLLSKSRRKTYKSEDLPHIAVVNKMKERDPGSEPQVGDRVPFVLIETARLDAKTFEKAEDPKYVERNNLKIDRLYYVEHQIVKPVTNLLEKVIGDTKALFKEHIRLLTLQRTNQSTIMKFLVKRPRVEEQEWEPPKEEEEEEGSLSPDEEEPMETDVDMIPDPASEPGPSSEPAEPSSEELPPPAPSEKRQFFIKSTKTREERMDSFSEKMMQLTSRQQEQMMIKTTKKIKRGGPSKPK